MWLLLHSSQQQTKEQNHIKHDLGGLFLGQNKEMLELSIYFRSLEFWDEFNIAILGE